MEDQYKLLKDEVLGMGLNVNDEGEQKRLFKITVTTLIDIAQSLNRIANKP